MRVTASIVLLWIFIFASLATAFGNENQSRRDCVKEMVEPTPENTFAVPSELWNATRKILQAGEEKINPPILILDRFQDQDDTFQYRDGTKDTIRIGCFDSDRWRIQIIPYPDRVIRDYFTMHDLAHAILHKRGMDIKLQHCFLANIYFSIRAVVWLRNNGREVDRFLARDIRISELRSCWGSKPHEDIDKDKQ